MMTTILLCVLLLLGIVWLILGIAYSYERWRSLSHQRISQRQEPQQREEEAHELVAKSKGLATHVIPPFPVSSVAEESNMNAPTFAEQTAEEEGEELDVDYTMEEYRARYFVPLRIREKTSFTMNAETLEILRSVLQDLHERVSMVSYIDNIIREHLRAHRELLNQASAKQRRKTTIPL